MVLTKVFTYLLMLEVCPEYSPEVAKQHYINLIEFQSDLLCTQHVVFIFGVWYQLGVVSDVLCNVNIQLHSEDIAVVLVVWDAESITINIFYIKSPESF